MRATLRKQKRLRGCKHRLAEGKKLIPGNGGSANFYKRRVKSGE